MRLFSDPDLILNQKTFAIGIGAKFGFYVDKVFLSRSSLKLFSFIQDFFGD